MKRSLFGALPVLALFLAMTIPASAQDPQTYDLVIMARNCDSELVEFFTRPQEGCVPAVGAFFNVTAESGEFLGNCEAEAGNSPIFASCTVEVPYGSTGLVTEDLASLPAGYVPRENPVAFYAEFADGEDYPPIFINELRPTTGLPNTGAGVVRGNNQAMLLTVLGVTSASALLVGLGLRTARRPV